MKYDNNKSNKQIVKQSKTNSIGRSNAVDKLGINKVVTDVVDINSKQPYAQIMGKMQFKGKVGKVIGYSPMLNDYNPALYSDVLDSSLVPSYANRRRNAMTKSSLANFVLIPTNLNMHDEFFGYTAEYDHFRIPFNNKYFEFTETGTTETDAQTYVLNTVAAAVNMELGTGNSVNLKYDSVSGLYIMYDNANSTILETAMNSYAVDHINSEYHDIVTTTPNRPNLITNVSTKYGTLTWGGLFTTISWRIVSDRAVEVVVRPSDGSITNLADCIQLANAYINKLSSYNVQQASNVQIALAKKTVQFKQLAIAANDTINPCYTKSLVDLYNSLFYNNLNAIAAIEAIQLIDSLYAVEDYMKLGAKDLFISISNDFYSQVKRDELQQAIASLKTNLYGTRVTGDIVADVVRFNKPSVTITPMYNQFKMVIPTPMYNPIISALCAGIFGNKINRTAPVAVDAVTRDIANNDTTYDAVVAEIYNLSAKLASATTHLFNSATAQYSTLDTIETVTVNPFEVNTEILIYLNNMDVARFQATGVKATNQRINESILNANKIYNGVIEDETGVKYLYAEPLYNSGNHTAPITPSVVFERKSVANVDHVNPKLGYAICQNLSEADIYVPSTRTINGAFEFAGYNLRCSYTGYEADICMTTFCFSYDTQVPAYYDGNLIESHMYYPYAISTFHDLKFIGANKTNYIAHCNSILTYESGYHSTTTANGGAGNNDIDLWSITFIDDCSAEFGIAKFSFVWNAAAPGNLVPMEIPFTLLSSYGRATLVHEADVSDSTIISKADMLNNSKYLA